MALDFFPTFILSFIIAYILDTCFAIISNKFYKNKLKGFHIGKYRIHHNLIGYISVIVGVFYYPQIFVGFGLGMILGHGFRDKGFWFVENI